MTAVPPRDPGGAGHRPPDPDAEEGSSTTGARHQTTGREAEPTIQNPQVCGPHQASHSSEVGGSEFPALVTTPSDAQGGNSAIHPMRDMTPSLGPVTRNNEGIATSPLSRSYATAIAQGGPLVPLPVAQPMPTAIKGRWKPRDQRLLIDTLAKPWHESTQPNDTPRQAEMRSLALAPSEVHGDEALRPLQEQETEVLLAYLDKSLELPHAPNFLKATLPLIQRAMVEHFHEAHLEVTLMADVSPSVKLRRNMTHNTLLAQLYEANADSPRGRQMIDHIMDNVKLLQFDGIHTLRFTFNSRRVAALYVGLAFRLRGTCIELEDTETGHSGGTLHAARIRRKYAIRVYGAASLGLVVLLSAIGNLPGVQVVDAERPRVDVTSQATADTRFLLIRFSTDECPEALRGVTKITIHGHVVTLHHYLVQTRMPCGRCFAPYHTTGFCRAQSGHLDRLHAKYKREYSGPVPTYTVGEAVQYRHSDGDSLATFLTQLQRDLSSSLTVTTTAAATRTEDGTEVAERATVEHRQLRQPDADAVRGSQPQPEPAPATLATPEEVEPDEGFQLVTRRSGKPSRNEQPHATRQTSRPHHKPASPAVRAERNQLRPDNPTTSKELNSRHGKQKLQGGRANNRAQGKRPKWSSNAHGFARFQQERDRGRYAALEEPEESDNDMSTDEERDEAPYAYPGSTTATEATMGVALPAVTSQRDARALHVEASNRAPPGSMTGSPHHSTKTLPLADEEEKEDLRSLPHQGGGEDTDMDSEVNSDVSGYVGSSAPSSTQSPAMTPGSEFQFSLDSDLNETLSQRDGAGTPRPAQLQAQPTQRQPRIQTTVVDAVGEQGPTLSQDGFAIEMTEPAPGMPQQLPVFMIPFEGRLTSVPANGQCAYAALYASTTATVEPKLTFTSEVVRGANAIKRSVYTLMMVNLANDIDCQAVDPCRELERLYPSHPMPSDPAVATASFYQHYAQERARSVNTHIPTSFWAGPEVLRAMSQYLREPLFVLDVDTHNDAHVQRYYYKDYLLPNGDVHKTGCGGAVDDATAKIMLAQYARLHVASVFLVLKRHEGHFYGVRHGEHSTKLQAEGDLKFAQDNCANHSWYPEVVAHTEYSADKLEGVDNMHDDDFTSMIIIFGAMERRDRLDVVHARLHLECLDSTPYDIAILERGLGAEAARLQDLAGQIGALDRDRVKSQEHERAQTVEAWAPISAHGRTAEKVYIRILDSIAMDPELLADRSKLRLLLKENATAFNTGTIGRRQPSNRRQPTEASPTSGYPCTG